MQLKSAVTSFGICTAGFSLQTIKELHNILAIKWDVAPTSLRKNADNNFVYALKVFRRMGLLTSHAARLWLQLPLPNAHYIAIHTSITGRGWAHGKFLSINTRMRTKAFNFDRKLLKNHSGSQASEPFPVKSSLYRSPPFDRPGSAHDWHRNFFDKLFQEYKKYEDDDDKDRLNEGIRRKAALASVNKAEEMVKTFSADQRNIFTCRKGDEKATVNLHVVMSAMLTCVEECGGESGKRYVASAIVSCGRNGDSDNMIEQLAALGTTWLTHLLFICKSQRPVSKREETTRYSSMKNLLVWLPRL
ncbi:uncharacterized protein LACBIDRAFT_328944 [Laccaria bicolor S238N-H82]|uniref:Predicted protein n=1 Tax=Laccaria bicolor (strain S238N-H82 / ATCC MYA-4686) TaxID=486041 RepID=B0DGI5_LACBS|nr:uncharacterized protein LACBIDRAFT_328944 [Laccaria bicolor S238N-H82]EDR06275.1 predicted protein [Laccaria bicolor S238N-H82]|eukprot:XP_001883136.1 predicted protein [Laccaria bicolor S238N-H82]